MDKLTYKDLIEIESNAIKEEYYYSHKYRKDKEDWETLDYYQKVLSKINYIKKLAVTKYLEENYVTINDIRFNL